MPKPSVEQAICAAEPLKSTEEFAGRARSLSYGIPSTTSSTETILRPRRRATLDTPVETELDDPDYNPSRRGSNASSLHWLSAGSDRGLWMSGLTSYDSLHDMTIDTNQSTLVRRAKSAPFPLPSADEYRSRLEEDGFEILGGDELDDHKYRMAKKAWEEAKRDFKAKRAEIHQPSLDSSDN